MEKTIKEVKEIEDIKHEFYCDECNCYLGTSLEYDDGYYKKFGELELKFYVDGWLYINKCLCDKCKSEFIHNIRETLLNIGFVDKW